jgi:hypothetical protein
VKSLRSNQAFRNFLESVQTQLHGLDKINRMVGQENKVSGAEALASLIEEVTACWESRADRDDTERQDSEG